MPVNSEFHVAVLPGDGIGTEIMPPCVEILDRLARHFGGFSFHFETLEAGAAHYQRSGTALPETVLARTGAADAILFGAMGLPDIRYPDGREIAPQLDLRERFELFAGVRPVRTFPGLPVPLADPRRQNLDFVLDILLNGRLYCAEYQMLNDPLEGFFIEEIGQWVQIKSLGTFAPVQTPRQVSDLPDHRAIACRVCSLSRPLDNIVLWSHYADGHRGVAIELDLPDDDDLAGSLRKIEYVKELPKVSATALHDLTAETVLSVKTREWEFEEEYRIVTASEHLPVRGHITAVYVGERASELHVDILKRCVPKEIPLISTRVSWSSTSVEIEGRLER